MESKNILFNNGQPILNDTASFFVEGRSDLTPRAYNLLNILSKRLMKRIFNTKQANDLIIESLIPLKSLRTTSITVDQFMNETGLSDYFVAKERLATTGLELNSFLMAFQTEKTNEVTVEAKDGFQWNIAFLQGLTESGRIYDDSGELDIEFLPDLVRFLVIKYRKPEFSNLKAHEYTADMLLADLMELGFSHIENYGFKLKNDFRNNPEKLKKFIRSNYCLGPAPIMV